VTSMNISVPERMRSWVEAQIAAGRYGNASEYFRHLIRRDQSEQAQRRLEELLLEGLASGDASEITPEFWDSKRRDFLERLRKRGS